MSKRNYIHVQALLLEEKTQREVAKYYGFRDKYAVKQLLTRERRKERKLEVGILPRPKGRPRKIQQRKILWPSRLMRFSGLVWKMNCCGIFCNSQKGSESKGKICSDLPSSGTVSCTCHVPILCSIQKRLLQPRKSDEPSRKRYGSCRNDAAATRQMFSYLWIPKNVAMAGKKYGNPP